MPRDQIDIPNYVEIKGDDFLIESLPLTKTEETAEIFQCDICRRVFHCKSRLIRHITIHDEYKKCVCKICKKRFKTVIKLSRHLRSSHRSDL